MKIYSKPMIIIEPLALNPHIEEFSWSKEVIIDPTIPVGDDGIELQDKGRGQKWGDLW